MKETYLLFGIKIIILLCIIIIIFLNYSYLKEGFNTNSEQMIILIGDSILNNSNYIGYGEKTTFDSLKEILGSNSYINNYAEDGATVNDCFRQLDKTQIENSIDNNNLYIVVSCGGNDILNSNILYNNVNIDQLVSKLTTLLKTIQTKFPSSQIRLLNLYYPFNSKYKLYKPIIELWNKNLVELCKKDNSNCKLVNIASSIDNPKDLIYDIEPSASGSRKLAICISNSL